MNTHRTTVEVEIAHKNRGDKHAGVVRFGPSSRYGVDSGRETWAMLVADPRSVYVIARVRYDDGSREVWKWTRRGGTVLQDAR